jgi:signal transduction histidine kinase
VTLDRLRAVPLLADLPDEMLTALLEAAPEVALDEGEVLLAEGDQASALYVVLEGELEVTKSFDGTDVLLAVCGRGELLGELSMVHGRPRSATARALTPARLLRIEPDALTELLTEPRVAVTLLATVTRRLEEIELHMRQHDRMATLGTLTAGLLHELNNPAAAIARSVEQLDTALTSWQGLDPRALDPDVTGRLARLLDEAARPSSAIARLDVEDRLEDLVRTRGLGDVTDASTLAAAGVDAEDLDELLASLPPACHLPAWQWLVGRGRLAALVAETSAAATRISEVVAAVKRYSHVDETPVQDVDVHEGLEAAWTLLGGRVPSRVELVRDYDPALPSIEGYPGDLNTVWTNLLDNALDAVGDQGTITVRTLGRDGGVEVSVENTGPEVPPRVLERVFDPFFTTKQVGKGSGIGLATSHGVVRRHRGQMRMTSEPGRTTVTVTLPIRGGPRRDHADGREPAAGRPAVGARRSLDAPVPTGGSS